MSFSRLLLLWFSAGWMTATVLWLVFQPISSVHFSRFRTQQCNSCSDAVILTTSVVCLSAFTGYECQKVSSSLSLGRLMLCCTFGSSRQSRSLLTFHLDKDFGPVPPIVCWFLPSDFLQLDIAPFPSLVHVRYMERLTFTHYLLTFSAYV